MYVRAYLLLCFALVSYVASNFLIMCVSLFFCPVEFLGDLQKIEEEVRARNRLTEIELDKAREQLRRRRHKEVCVHSMRLNECACARM